MIRVGNKILAKVEGKTSICTVEEIFDEYLILSHNNIKFRAEHWEVRKIEGTSFEEKK